MKSSPADAPVRRARPDDAAAVARIEKAWPTAAGWSQEQLAAEAARPDALFSVAEEKGAVAAYVVARLEAGELRVYAVGVEPSFARRGLARRVLSWTLAQAKAAGCAKASLEVGAKNEAAIGLYQAAGFRVVGRRPKFYNDGSDALLLDLRLT